MNEENNISFLTRASHTHIYISLPLKVKKIKRYLFFADRCKFKNPGNDISSGYKAKETLDCYDSCRDISRGSLHSRVHRCVRTHLHTVDEIIGVKTSAYIYDRINPRKYRVHRHKRDRYKYMTTVYTKSTPLPKSTGVEFCKGREIVIYGSRRWVVRRWRFKRWNREKSEWYRFILATLASTRGIRDCDLEFFGTWTNTFFLNIFFVSLHAIYQIISNFCNFFFAPNIVDNFIITVFDIVWKECINIYLSFSLFVFQFTKIRCFTT